MSGSIAESVAVAAKVRSGLWAHGYRPVPVTTFIPGLNGSGKRPLGSDWANQARLNPPAAVSDEVSGNGLNTGILCDALRVVDIDTDVPGLAATIRELALTTLGPAPIRGRGGSDRCALFFAAAEGAPEKLKIVSTQGAVEVLGRGQQIVVHGRHPSGMAYTWEKTLSPRAKLTVVTEAQVKSFLNRVASLIGAEPAKPASHGHRAGRTSAKTRASVADVEAALAVIPNDGPADWDHWTKIGMATWVAVGGDEEGFRLFDEWSSRNPSYDAAGARRRWDSIASSPPFQIGAGTIFFHACRADPSWKRASVTTAADEFEPLEDSPATMETDQLSELENLLKKQQLACEELLDADLSLSGERAPENSDQALALSFGNAYAGRLLHLPERKLWLKWSGSCWIEDNTLAFEDLLAGYLRGRANEVACSGREGAAREARNLASAKTRSAVQTFVRSDGRHTRSVDAFDTNIWELNTPGGIIDLRTARLRPHRRGEMVMKIAGTVPDPACRIDRWRTFMSQACQGDPELVSYLQRWAGYTLTGVTHEHAFLFLVGPGGNGKGVFLNTLAKLLGTYATAALATAFIASRHEAHPTQVAALQGARMVIASETAPGAAWHETRLKSLTGGDTAAARVMNGNVFTFKPMFKLFVASNHEPELQNPDAGMRRRLNLVRFDHIPTHPDTLLEEALKEELPGILHWALQGCLSWQSIGLSPPPLVKAATDAYFEDQDIVGKWLVDRCENTSGAATGTRELFVSWSNYAREAGQSAQTEKWFSSSLARLRSRKKTNTGTVFLDVRLRDDYDTVELV